MIRLIIIAGLLVSHSTFAATGNEARLKKLLSCEAAMQASPDSILSRAKNLLDKYELLNIITPDILKKNMNISSATFFAELSSIVTQALTPHQADPVRLSQVLGELERAVDSTLASEQKKPRFDGRGKARMETRHFQDPMDFGDYPLAEPQQQQQPQLRSLNPTPPPPAPGLHGSEHLPQLFRSAWPPREKP